MNELETKVHNLEVALVGFYTLLHDTLPPAYQTSLTKLIQDLTEANAALGSEAMDADPNQIFRSK